MGKNSNVSEIALSLAKKNSNKIDVISNGVISKYVPYESIAFGNFVKPTYEGLIDLWDAIPNAKWEKRQIGLSSDGRPLYCYEMGKKSKQVVVWHFIQHGWEWKPSRVAIEFFKKMFSGENAYLTWLSEAYHWVIVPCVNPWGFDNDERLNADGIDINRDAVNVVAPESIAINNLFNEFDKIYQYMNFHAQTDPVTRESRISWEPATLRTEEYDIDAIEFTAEFRKRLKKVIDISTHPNCFSRGILASGDTTEGKWTEKLTTDGKILRMSATPEVWFNLQDNVFQEVQYAMIIEICRILLDWDRIRTPYNGIIIPTTNPHIATVPKNVAVLNRAYLVPLMIPQNTRVRKIRCQITAGTGNICIGIYDKDLNLLYSVTEEITASAVVLRDFELVLESGLNYIALSSDSLTVTFLATDGGSASLVRTQRIDSGFPLPSKGVLNGNTSAVVPLILLSTE